MSITISVEEYESLRQDRLDSALKSIRLEIHNLDIRLKDEATPEKVVDYITNVQKPRFEQIEKALCYFQKY